MHDPRPPIVPAGADSNPDAAPPERPPSRPRRWTYKKGVRHFKVMDMLRPEDRAAYLEFIARPSTTVDSSVKWLAERGYVAGRYSVYRHRKHFLNEAADVRRSAEFAHQFVELARGESSDASAPALAGAFAEATQTAFEQFFMNGVMAMKNAGRDLEPRQWAELSRAVAGAVGARRQVEAMRADFADRAKKAAEAVEQAGSSRDWKRDGVKVADAVRRILGVPLPDEPVPDDDPSLALIEFPGGRPPRRLPPPSDN